jgi:hypothetical protein
MGISIGHDINNTYENGDECVPIWKRKEMRKIVYIHIRRNLSNGHTNRKGGQKYEQCHAYNKFKEWYEYGTEHKTHSARNTGSTTGREENRGSI